MPYRVLPHMEDRAELHQLLARQDGVISIAQAVGCGLSRSAVQRRVTSGEWSRVAVGIFVAASHLRGPRSRARVAVLAVGDRAVLAGSAAAWWLHLTDAFPAHITVAANAKGRHARIPAGVRVTHQRIAAHDIVEHERLRVTGVSLTALDAAAECGVRVLDNAVLRGRVTLGDLVQTHRRYAGRRGWTSTGEMLRAMVTGARSEAERILVGIAREAGVVGWRANHPACGYLIDLAYPAERVAIEVDGFAFHVDVGAFQHDRTKQNALVAAGWTILRFTWSDLTERRSTVMAQIIEATGVERAS